MAAPPPPPAAAAAAAGPTPPAQVVGNAFVTQYYNILHQSPELVFRFYQEASHIGRPATAGADLDTVTTMEAINEKITSMDIARAEIKGVDAQDSLCGGVTVLVTGHLTGKDDVCREFVQSFFLAPQEKGYFVLNDILRYVGQGEAATAAAPSLPLAAAPPQQPAPEFEAAAAPAAAALPNGTVDAPAETAPRDLDAQPQPEPDLSDPAPHEEEDPKEEVYNPPNEVEVPVVEEIPVAEVIDEVPNNVVAASVPVSAPPVPQEEAPKKSYASIVKVMKAVLPPNSAVPYRPAPPKPEKQAPPAPAPVVDAPAFSPNPESSTIQDPEVDALAVYVKNLPLHATPSQLEEAFKTFGTIKPDGIQVRSHKIQGFCYGFIEFEDASSVQSALAASPVTIDDRPCHVEEKRTPGSRGSSRGRFPPGRGGNFRGEGMRGRGSYTGGRGYGRGDFNYRSEYGGRGGGRGGSARGGGEVGYQRVDHSSTGGRGGARAAAK
ncbi:nuclear transport factor 2-like [Lolium rigidum]|uniref:nuclear transport factor 2-like n=1 Tax=Lolium rigidum TaxID=89674 RepID=UPI001F5E2939|nr:nuclear transport factor 2-like [Lolium rigidum]